MHAIKRIHLVKMQLPFDGVNTYLRISSFGDNLEFAFFGALASVGALFILYSFLEERKCLKKLSLKVK